MNAPDTSENKVEEAGEDEVKQSCKKALSHVLHKIKDNPRVQYELGAGTQCFELVTAAAALLWNQPVDTVRDHFIPGSSQMHK